MKAPGHFQDFAQPGFHAVMNEIGVAGTVKGALEIELARARRVANGPRVGLARYSPGLSKTSSGSRPFSRQAMAVMILKVEPGG